MDRIRSRRLRAGWRALFGAALAFAASACGSGQAPDPRPNVIVLSIDTLRADALESLEHFRAFEERSVAFTEAYSTAAWTLPAHASLLSGLYSDRHGAYHERLRIDPKVELLSGRLRGAGYETVGFGDGVFLDGDFGFEKGFERYDDASEGSRANSADLPREGACEPVPGTAPFDRALAFLRERDDSRPFFLFLQTYAVHDYFRAHAWATSRWPGRAFGDSDRNVETLYGIRYGSPEEWEALRDLYRAELERFDGAFGELLSELERSDLAKNTFVVVLSDHGEAFEPERKRTHHGGRLNADQLHVPLFVTGPGVSPARRSDRVSLVDVFPTLVELTGGAAAPNLDGVSFSQALFGGPELAARPLFAHEYNFVWLDGRRAQVDTPAPNPEAIAVLAADHWYIDNGRIPDELYSISADPEQRSNRLSDVATVRSLHAITSGRRHFRPPTILAPESAARSTRMRELGYTGQ